MTANGAVSPAPDGPAAVSLAAGGRVMLLVAHTGRPAALRVARALIARLTAAGIGIRVLAPEAAELNCATAVTVPASAAAAVGTEMVLVVGGDGTLLRAAELARPAGVPLLGVNLGHVGFLAEAEPEDLTAAVANVAARRYSVERRMTVEVAVRVNGGQLAATWALNEATVEKAARERMLDLVIEVDGRPLSRWGCDGVVFATPTGSTAYAFSAGGPVVWPEVEALLMVPISAHALFAGPMVVSPESVLAAEVIGAVGGQPHPAHAAAAQAAAGGQAETAGAVLWCDGRRMVELPPGARVEVRRGHLPVLLARLPAVTEAGRVTTEGRIGAPFTDRLVAKFGLPVTGWRGQPGDRAGTTAGIGTRDVRTGDIGAGAAAAREAGAGQDGAGSGADAGRAAGPGAPAGEDEMGEDAIARDAVVNRADEEPGGHA